QEARSRRRLTVDQARTAWEVGQRVDPQRISRREQQALAPFGKADDCVPMRMQPLAIGRNEIGAATAIDMEPGKLAALGNHRVDAVDTAATLHIELDDACLVD